MRQHTSIQKNTTDQEASTSSHHVNFDTQSAFTPATTLMDAQSVVLPPSCTLDTAHQHQGESGEGAVGGAHMSRATTQPTRSMTNTTRTSSGSHAACKASMGLFAHMSLPSASVPTIIDDEPFFLTIGGDHLRRLEADGNRIAESNRVKLLSHARRMIELQEQVDEAIYQNELLQRQLANVEDERKQSDDQQTTTPSPITTPAYAPASALTSTATPPSILPAQSPMQTHRPLSIKSHSRSLINERIEQEQLLVNSINASTISQPHPSQQAGEDDETSG